MAVRIVIFEDNTRLRQSLTTLLNGIEGYLVRGDYENCLNAAAIVDEHHPDVVIMDIDMPGTNGLQGIGIENAGLVQVVENAILKTNQLAKYRLVFGGTCHRYPVGFRQRDAGIDAAAL